MRHSFELESPPGAYSAISCDVELFHVPELLFNPDMYASGDATTSAGLADVIVQAVAHCNPALHKSLLANVVVAGDLARLRGFRERLARELQQQTKQQVTVQVVDDVTAFKGCCLAARAIPDAIWISEQEFIASGEAVIRERCY